MSGPHTTNDVGLAESALLEPQRWGRVGEAEEEAPRANPSHDPATKRPSTTRMRQIHRVHDERAVASPALGDHPRQHRVGRVEGAGVGRGVRPHLDVEQVVHEIVGHVGQDEADEGEDEQAGTEPGTVDGQQRRPRPGHQGHGQDRSPGEHQPARHGVEGTARRRVGGAQHLAPGREPALGGRGRWGRGQDVAHLCIVSTGPAAERTRRHREPLTPGRPGALW